MFKMKIQGDSSPAFWTAWFFFFSLPSDVQVVKLCDDSFPQESVALSAFRVILKTEYMPSLWFTVSHWNSSGGMQ